MVGAYGGSGRYGGTGGVAKKGTDKESQFFYLSLLYYNRGGALFRLKRQEECIADCNAAVERNPKFAMAFVLLGRAYLAQNMLQHAKGSFVKALRLHPSNNKAKRGLQLVTKTQNQQVLDSNRARPSILLQRLHSTGPEMEEEIEEEEVDVSNLTEAEKKIKEGDAKFRVGNYADAILQYSQAIEIDSMLALAYFNRAAAHICLSEFEEATKNAYRCVLLDPGSAAARTRLGRAYLGEGRYVKARDAFESALEIDPSNVLAHKGLVSIEQMDSWTS